MALQDKLDAIGASFADRAPPHVIAAMKKATADLVATGQAGRALQVGDRAPDFTLPGPDGKDVSSRDLLARGPLVITFYRGVWCPYCNAELQALQDALPDLTAQRGSLVAISPENAANSRKATRQNELSFPILTDKGNEVAAAFGLRFRLPDELITIYKGFGNDLAAVNGEPSWTLPMPGRFVVAPDGVIAYAEVNPDYTRRPDPADMMDALRQAADQVAGQQAA
jgi:peroxiredoxin